MEINLNFKSKRVYPKLHVNRTYKKYFITQELKYPEDPCSLLSSQMQSSVIAPAAVASSPPLVLHLFLSTSK